MWGLVPWMISGPATQLVRLRSLHRLRRLSLWQGTLFAMACNICACMKQHGTLLHVP